MAFLCKATFFGEKITFIITDYEMGNIKLTENTIKIASEAEFADVLLKLSSSLYSSIQFCIL